MSGATTAIVLVITLEIAGSSVGEMVATVKEVAERVVEMAVDVFTAGPDLSHPLQTAVATEMIAGLAHLLIATVAIVDAGHLPDAVKTAQKIVLWSANIVDQQATHAHAHQRAIGRTRILVTDAPVLPRMQLLTAEKAGQAQAMRRGSTTTTSETLNSSNSSSTQITTKRRDTTLSSVAQVEFSKNLPLKTSSTVPCPT